MTQYLAPPCLRPGDKVGVFAASYPCAVWFPQRFSSSIDALRRTLGVIPIVAPHVTQAVGYESGTIEQRADELQEFLCDPEIKAIFTTIGGFNSAEILPFLDFSLFSAAPKILVGYSDTTSIQIALTSLCGWITFSGPALMPQFGEYPQPLPYTVDSLKNVIMKDSVGLRFEDPAQWTNEFLDWGSEDSRRRPRSLQPDVGREIWRAGTASGCLFGGNIDTLNFLIGTPYIVWPSEFILFIEATDASAALPSFQRALTHLRQCGVFHRVSGLLIGRCPDSKAVAGIKLREMILQVLKDFSFPIVSELSFGHSDPMLTLPIGARVLVDACSERASITVMEQTVAL